MSEHTVALPTGSAPTQRRTRGLLDWFRREAGDRADRRLRVEDDAQRVGDLKWRWRQACEVTGLGRMTFMPSGPTVSIPLIGRVTLGAPTTFTVRPQPGQLLADFEAAAPRIASAIGVSAVRVRPLAAEWLLIELHAAATPGRAAAPVVRPLPTPGWSRPDRTAPAAA